MPNFRPLLFLAFGTALSLLVLNFTISTITKAQVTPGCQSLASLDNFELSPTVAFWRNEPISPPSYLASNLTEDSKKVLGAVSDDSKWIEVDLTKQWLLAHQGNQIVFESAISSGLYNRTPVGTFRIWYKTRSTLMEGGSKLNHTYYYLPNVPYDMFFYKDYGIHGTYWHNNFGQPMSHGCVNAPTPIAEKLFYWTDPQLPSGTWSMRSDANHPGTRVVIHY